ncbi:hypothetical protein KBB96_13665 [Luteolibacter ambystomatis]|uniref:Uncharacterized protein n=1 Tax=Luteolibacter ambystomatis TaxID=2824561 RepID=A0A975G6W2_9BACT|nr:hypothetical protein [Luteolibacter ambystomatis]QUE49912.1 hypothetical protein KBB96_13665 [Luteolibacter ambystomatis]
MSSRRYHSGRSSKWNGNQKCLAVAVVIMGGLTLLCLIALVQDQRAKHPEAGIPGILGAAAISLVCPGLFVWLPLIILWRSLAKSSARSLKAVVRSQAYRGGGFSDLTLKSDQNLPRICLCCGTATNRVTPLRYENAHTEASVYDWGRAGPFLLLAPFFTLIQGVLMGAMFWQSVEKRLQRRKAREGAVLFRIPHCRTCSKQQPIVQRHFDFHGRSMIVDAHPAFRSALG